MIRNKLYSLLSLILAAAFILSAIILTGHGVYAGDINGNEASVIAVASGTFTYNGKVYKAYDSYVNQLYSYMAQDGVDLTAEQAARAISYIYSNVQAGVNSGYVYEVTEQEENNVDVEEAVQEMEEQEQQAQEEKYEEAKSQAQEASDKEVEEMFQQIEEDQKERQNSGSSKPSATESDATVVIQKDEIVVTTDDKEWSVKRTERIVPESITTALIVISAAILVIDVVIAMVLIFAKCMRFGDEHSHRKIKSGHRKRRKIRKVCRRILIFTTAVGLFIVFMIVGISVGVFSNNHLSNSIQSSGYFRYAYTQYVKNAVAEAGAADDKNSVDGSADKKSDDKTNGTDKNSANSTTNKNDSTAKDSTDDLESMDISNVNIMTYDEFLVQEKQALSNMKESELTKEISIVPYISQLRKDLREPLLIAVIIIGVAYMLSMILNLFMDMKRDRGIKALAVSDIIATLILLVVVVAIWIWYTTSKLFIEPDYLFNFIGDFIEWVVKVLASISFFGAAIGMAMVGLYNSMRKEH